MTDLAIVIVSFNAGSELARCLASLAACPPACSYETVVVDNASSDGTVELVQSTFPAVRIIETGANMGFARASNIGIRATSSEFVLLLNSDTTVGDGSIDSLLRALRANNDVAVAGPRLVDAHGVPELSTGMMIGPLNELRQKAIGYLHARGNVLARRYVDRLSRRAHFPEWVSGACLMMRRRDGEAVGLLDERYFIYCEDVDFCAAIRKLGRRILFTPEAEFVHLRGRSVVSAPEATERAYRRSHLAFYEKHRPGWAPLLRLYLRLRGKEPTG